MHLLSEGRESYTNFETVKLVYSLVGIYFDILGFGFLDTQINASLFIKKK